MTSFLSPATFPPASTFPPTSSFPAHAHAFPWPYDLAPPSPSWPTAPRPRPTSVDAQRRSCIRKKNGRIDIPRERNIPNIDALLQHTTDEAVLRELKQQKRLLRNREAALASRQRKKKHTEELEDREKGLARDIAHLHADAVHAELRHDAAMRDAHRVIQALHDERREVALQHAEETAQLRKRILLLSERVDAVDAKPLHHCPDSLADWSDFHNDVPAVPMTLDWDPALLFPDLAPPMLLPPSQLPSSAASDSARSSPRTIVPAPSPRTLSMSTTATMSASTMSTTTTPPIASGLLFFLLLAGALVASRPPTALPALPLPHDVRAAAPQVLDDLLSGGAAAASAVGAGTGHVSLPSGCASASGSGPAPDRMSSMHSRLLAPTKQQEIDAAFALSPAQYAAISHMDLDWDASATHANPPVPAAPRRSLAASLGGGGGVGSAADVYTRSLLWDQIPPDVLRQFREVARAYAEAETEGER